LSGALLSGEGQQYENHSNTIIFHPATHLFLSSTTDMSLTSRDIEERIAEASQAMDNDPTLKTTGSSSSF
jgi:hypothetical protein